VDLAIPRIGGLNALLGGHPEGVTYIYVVAFTSDKRGVLSPVRSFMKTPLPAKLQS